MRAVEAEGPGPRNPVVRRLRSGPTPPTACRTRSRRPSGARVASRLAASSAASAATAVGRSSGGSASSWARRRHPGQHEDAPGADRTGRREVRADPVADHDRLAPARGRRRAAAASSRYGAGLPIDSGHDPGRGLDRGDERAGTRAQAALGRVDRVAVGGDEPGAGPDAVRGRRRAGGRSGSDRGRRRPRPGAPAAANPSMPSWLIRVAAVPALTTSKPASRSSRSRPPAPRTSTRRIPGSCSAEVERGGPCRRDDRVRADRRAHRCEPGLVVGPVVHRVVRDVDDVVAARGAIRQHGGHARDRVRAAVDDAVEVDQEEEAHAPDRSRAPAGAYDGSMPAPDRNPLANTDRLLVDGTNLLHSISRTAGRRPAGGADRAAPGGRPGPGRHRARLRRPAGTRPPRRADRLRDLASATAAHAPPTR